MKEFLKNIHCLRIKSLKKISKKLFLEYLEKSAIHGLLNIRREFDVKIGRWVWIFVIAGILFFTNYNIIILFLSFLNSPTETNLSTNPIHIKHIPFPAIAVCGANRISRKALSEFATEVYQYDRGRDKPFFKSMYQAVEQTKRFADFFSNQNDIKMDAVGETDIFNQILTSMYNSSNYPTRDILRRLSSVNCTEMIIACHLKRQKKNCSELFYARMTTFGICCIYNYKRSSYSDDDAFGKTFNHTFDRIPEYSKSAGQFSALTIGLKTNYSDFLIKDFAMDSYRIMLFHHLDYPDFSSESESAVFVEFNSDSDISINPTILIGSNDMKSFSPDTRQCYFEEEGNKMIHQKYYSLEECLIKCQVESTQRYCGCVHPLWPRFTNNESYCGLVDLPCLAVWRWIWYKWEFFDYTKTTGNSAQEQNCPHCKPGCNVLRYSTDKSAYDMLPPINGKFYKYGVLKNIKWELNMTLVRIFFKSRNSYPHTQKVSGNWVDLLARFGGLCCIMYGFSFVSIIDWFYYLTGKFFIIIWKHFRQDRCNKKKVIIQTNSLPSLYWNEMRSNRKHNNTNQ